MKTEPQMPPYSIPLKRLKHAGDSDSLFPYGSAIIYYLPPSLQSS